MEKTVLLLFHLKHLKTGQISSQQAEYQLNIL